MKLVDMVICGVAAAVGSDLAQEYVPADVDVSGLPVRKYGGAVLGVYLAGMLGAIPKMSIGRTAAFGIIAVAASDFAQANLPADVDVSGLPIRKYGGAVLGVWGAQVSGIAKAAAQVAA